MTQTGAIASPTVTLQTAGAVALDSVRNAATTLSGTAGGGFAFRNGRDLTVTTITAGQAVVLTSDLGTLTQTGAVTGRSLALSAVNLAIGGKAVLQATTEGITAVAGRSLTLRGTATAPGMIDLEAGSALTLDGATLTSSGGNVASLIGSGAFSSAGASQKQGLLHASAAGDILVQSVVLNAEAAELLARGTLTVTALDARIGTALLLQAPGGIAFGGTLTLSARSSTRLPAMLYDTRRGSYANPLSLVQPDVPGLTQASQPTQVARGLGSPGAFGPSNGGAAGQLAFDLAAGNSAVFLLLDGGSATGTLTAGRLGVHGTGGTVSLSGTLAGSDGFAAARFGGVTRPISPEALQRYRINGCVLTSVSCVVPPTVQVLPPRPTDRVDLTLRRTPINTSDVTVPNIAETEYE